MNKQSKEKNLQLNLEKNVKKDIREWAFVFLGSAVGAGILLLPLRSGEVSLYTTLLSMLVALIGTYIGHQLMIRLTTTTPNCQSYDSSIEYHLGKIFGIGLSLLFIVFLFSLIVILGIAITSNLSAMLHYYHLIPQDISKNPLYILICIIALAVPLLISERFLLQVIEKIVAFKILILFILIIMFIPLWKFSNVEYYLSWNASGVGIFSGVFKLLPVLIFGATFFPSIGSMSRFFKSNYPTDSIDDSFKKANASNKIAMILLAIVLCLFLTSTLFALTPSSLSYAAQHNLTALAVIAQTGDSGWIATFAIFAGYLITVLALLTSFYAVIIGVIDGVLTRLPAKYSNCRKQSIVGVFILLYLWIVLNINILQFIEKVVSPLIVLFVFFVPVVSIYLSPSLKKYRGLLPMISVCIGVFLLLASFI